MPTNNEIKKKYNIKKQKELLTLKDLEKIIGTEGFNGLVKDWNNQISLFLDDLDKMLNEARADGYKEGVCIRESLAIMFQVIRANQTIKLKSKFRNILHAFANDPDKSFKHIDEILKNIEVD